MIVIILVVKFISKGVLNLSSVKDNIQFWGQYYITEADVDNMQTNEHSDAPTEILITKTGSEPDSVHGLYFFNYDLE